MEIYEMDIIYVKRDRYLLLSTHTCAQTHTHTKLVIESFADNPLVHGEFDRIRKKKKS